MKNEANNIRLDINPFMKAMVQVNIILGLGRPMLLEDADINIHDIKEYGTTLRRRCFCLAEPFQVHDQFDGSLSCF